MKKDNVELICSISELSSLFKEKTNVQGFLSKVTSTIAAHMNCDSCSIFLLDDISGELVLEATEGLNRDFIGKLRLKPGEGLTGQALMDENIIIESEGLKNPNYKKVLGFGEEVYHSFLAAPILSGLSKIGVLVLEHKIEDFFNINDQMAVKAIASQLATTLENAKLLISLRESRKIENKRITGPLHIRGIASGSGIATGKALILGDSPETVFLEAGDIDYGESIEDFEASLNSTVRQVEDLQEQMEVEHSDVASMIFSTHLLMLSDSSFSGEMANMINGGDSPVDSIIAIVNKYITIFKGSNNPRLQEKVQDIKDLGHRLLRNLRVEEHEEGDYSGQIIVARELLPSELIKITAQNAEGLVLFGGGATAHITILAKSLGVPIVFTDNKQIFDIQENSHLIIDANEGHIFVNPDAGTVRKYKRHNQSDRISEEEISSIGEQTYTADKKRIRLLANINLLSDLKNATLFKAEGIGLYRSEFPFIIRDNFPSEEEQFQIYKKLIERAPGEEMTLRTLDIGGDKILSYMKDIEEENPFLGLRAIRFLLKNEKIFQTQLKAMLRAGAGSNLRIMFPLISSVDDLIAARKVVDKCLKDLKRDGLKYNKKPEIGVMIELPSAVMVIEEICEMADFVSVGTNDLVQYMIGVDRSNDHVAWLYTAQHPAILRALKKIADGAALKKCDVSICGNIAGDEKLIEILIGLGFRKFSMNPAKIPEVQKRIEKIDTVEAAAKAEALLEKGLVSEVKEYFESHGI
ncbi:phosphoenolpyruvate--protein phosphotransferase [Spirochaeta isovalerica]|uniref:phosphoenolpyruvate--protein phosphotransferase n=1 Tax=Spirochaeta isovalerica TaxID=150 RepID=A0A841RG97_9SPIO|nr:phosphoenolpyruvate--protein phosphotransferase [Spirochaeta isovalerica]MBB6482030.1 phosphotransferase system enzyme I (PtsP) [Spirochaeta isovalerica]